MAYQTVNPANNQLIKTYPAHSDADVEAALQQADALYHSAWAKGDIEPRLAVLHKLADLIDSRVEDLAKIASQEMGKLIKQSRGEVKLCAQIARYYADNAKSMLAPVKYPSELGEAWVEHHPIGVLLAVEPWNFPYYQLMRVLGAKPGGREPGYRQTRQHRAALCGDLCSSGARGRRTGRGVDQSVYLSGSGGEDYRRRPCAGGGADRVGKSRQRGGGAGGASILRNRPRTGRQRCVCGAR